MMSSTVPLDTRADLGALRWVLTTAVSRLCALTTARFSYSSHSLSVFPGVHGGGRGSLNGEIVLASGGD